MKENILRKALTLVAAGLGLLLSAPLAANAAEPAEIMPSAYNTDVGGVATGLFAKSSGGVTLSYMCTPVSGNTRVQLVNPAQTVAHRDFPAICDGRTHNLGSLNAPSNTSMRARVHNYSGQRMAQVFVQAECWGYYP